MPKTYVSFDEYEDVLASTDLLALVAPTLQKMPSNWKWMILAAQNGVQGSLVCAVQDSTATNILHRDSAARTLEWLATLEGNPPKEILADFRQLLKRYRKKYPCHCITAEQIRSLHTLHREFRNSFAHFTPQGWLIETAMLPPLVASALELISEAMQQHQVEVHFNEVMKRRLTSNLAATRAALGITKG
jgi:hypothetical protein